MKSKIRPLIIGVAVLVSVGGVMMFIGAAPAQNKNPAVSGNKSSDARNKSAKTGSTQKGTRPQKTPAPPALSSYRISSYRIWTCANPQPYFVPAPQAAMCAPITRFPPQNSPGRHSAPNPHQDKYIRVFVNSTGRQALMEMKTPKFPPGSVIVKEKLTTDRIRTAELLTIMVKRGKGYDPQNGDWEYLVTDGHGREVRQRGKLANCQACHVPRKKSDYVFRDYLPDEVERRPR